MLENNLTKDETQGNYERQYWNLHQSHGRPWDPLSEQVLTAQVLIVKAVKTIIVALSSTQWCHSFFRSGQISLLLFIQLVATVLVIWERCLSFVQAVCAFTNCAGGHPWVAVYVDLSAGPLVYGFGGYCPCEGSDILVLSLQQKMLSLNILSILSAPRKIICSCNAMVKKYRGVNSANTPFFSSQFLSTLG